MDMKLNLILLIVAFGYAEFGAASENLRTEDVVRDDSSNKHKKSSGGHGWDYASNGPSTWGKYSKFCDGNQQSPINIVTCETSKFTYSNQVVRHNYWKLFNGKYTMKNNGHALQIDLPADTRYFLMKGHKRYTPLQIHIHFDPVTGKGSEHTLNSKKYFAEIHIVHKKSAYKGKSFMDHRDGLLVVGIFVDLLKGGKKSMPADLEFNINDPESKIKSLSHGNSFAMSLFAKVAKTCVNPDTKKEFAPFPLAWLLPKVHRRKSNFGYVNYHGSLTTPPCSEIVDWVVITGKLLEINEATANEFKMVQNSLSVPMAGNNRPIQELGDRDVYGVQGSL